MKAQSKLTTDVEGQRRIVSEPPLIQPVEEISPDVQADQIYKLLREVLGKYQRTLQSDRRPLQHLMRAESDIFLGWTHVVGPAEVS